MYAIIYLHCYLSCTENIYTPYKFIYGLCEIYKYI